MSIKYLAVIVLFLLASCYHVERNCTDFKTGEFRSEVTIGGVKKSTTSIRTENLVIETYEGKTDTASIRWVNDCEYVIQKINPKNMAEKKAIAIKILTTSEKTYTFEFGIVGSDNKQTGTAIRIN
jgi:hypothetical protein